MTTTATTLPTARPESELLGQTAVGIGSSAGIRLKIACLMANTAVTGGTDGIDGGHHLVSGSPG